MASGGPEIEQLIQLLARLPGLGPRSARRAVLTLIKKKDQLMIPLSAALDRAVSAVRTCEICGNVDTVSPCTVCADPRRAESGMLIVVEDVADLWALERAGVGAVRYHVLGGVLSPLDGVGPDDISIDDLLKRAGDFKEIVLAVNATVEGQTTAHYITDWPARTSRSLASPTASPSVASSTISTKARSARRSGLEQRFSAGP